MKLMDNLHLSDQALQSNFKDINDLVDCLQRLHPNHFTPTMVSDVKSRLDDVSDMFQFASIWPGMYIILFYIIILYHTACPNKNLTIFARKIQDFK